MKKPRLSPGLLVALVFAGGMAIVLSIVFLFGDGATPEEVCKKQCSAEIHFGRMVPEFPPEQTAGMRGGGTKRCECYGTLPN
jgi:hypothetical protein